MPAARSIRTTRTFLRAQLEQYDHMRAAVRDRDLREPIRQQHLSKIDADAREVYTRLRREAEQRIEEARREVAPHTPAGRRRAAVLSEPARYTAVIGALAHVADSELPRYAELAGDDVVVHAALLTSIGGRPKLAAADAQFIAHRANAIAEPLRTQLVDLAVAVHELAGLVGEYARRGGGDRELQDVARLASSARSLELDGLHMKFSDTDLDEAYTALGIARQTDPTETPAAVPGTVVPWSVAS
jgi:hypothetical protein